MKMRMLTIDQTARDLANRIRTFAIKHPYRLGEEKPGQNPNYCGYFDTFRAVFSITHVEGIAYRHLSVSIPADGDVYPNPLCVFMLADLFGFTGWNGVDDHKIPADWKCGPNAEEQCVVVMQAIGVTSREKLN